MLLLLLMDPLFTVDAPESVLSVSSSEPSMSADEAEVDVAMLAASVAVATSAASTMPSLTGILTTTVSEATRVVAYSVVVAYGGRTVTRLTVTTVVCAASAPEPAPVSAPDPGKTTVWVA